MSCDDYVDKLTTFLKGLTVQPHSAINQDGLPESSLARVQTDMPALGIIPLGQVNPPNSLSIGGQEFGSVFVSQENPWYEDWVVVDMTKIWNGSTADDGTAQLWRQKDGTTFLAALPGIDGTTGSDNYRWLAMESFEYFEKPHHDSIPKPSAGCVRHKQCFEVFNIVDGLRFESLPGHGVVPTGFLYRQFLQNSGGEMRFVDFWLLSPLYQPPEGQRRVALRPLSSQPGSANLFVKNKGALLAAQGELTFVCIPVTAAPLPPVP